MSSRRGLKLIGLEKLGLEKLGLGKLGLGGLGLVVALMGTPGFAADARNGESLARRWCVACHVVASSQHRSSTDQAPPFATIASRPGFNAGKLALFLLDPHPKMPDMGLARSQAADLAAYIETLRR
jgi:mono/diheme cytochrome c family protein